MKRIGICGHFGGDRIFLDGQTVKTITITESLKKHFDSTDINVLDTYYAKKNLIKFIFQLIELHIKSKNIIIFPAQKSLIVCAFLFSFLNLFNYRPIHYVVIGGWLSDFLIGKPSLQRCIRKFESVYVETEAMKNNLNKQLINNVVIMPNSKRLNILKREDIHYIKSTPFKLCTFSRVRKEKGIEDAIKVVKKINEKYDEIKFTLDIYGQVDDNYSLEFEQIMHNTPEYIQYKGLVQYDQSVETLKDYYALLFPTYYSGEGFAGTIIDAFSSGVPVIASDWRYNQEIVTDKYTGLIYKCRDNVMFYQCLEWIMRNIDQWNAFKINCLKEVEKYNVDKTIKILIDRLI